ncbi:MAG: YjzC family protein [Solirubrobacterales bacterium]|nr:YjzC family protein [Solirubrobacterales bacterium]
MSSTIYRPGQTVPRSGIYNVADVSGTYMGRQVTGEAGRTFEPTRHGTREYGYMLFRETTHMGA